MFLQPPQNKRKEVEPSLPGKKSFVFLRELERQKRIERPRLLQPICFSSHKEQSLLSELHLGGKKQKGSLDNLYLHFLGVMFLVNVGDVCLLLGLSQGAFGIIV